MGFLCGTVGRRGAQFPLFWFASDGAFRSGCCSRRTGGASRGTSPTYKRLTESSASRSLKAGPFGQQSHSLLVIHGLPRDQSFGQHIQSAKDRQLEEKSHKIQVPEDQRPSLPHPVANPFEVGWHLAPVKPGAVVMAEVVSFVHEVHLIHHGYRIREIIFRTFRVTKSVLDPCGDCVDEIHRE